MPKVMQWEGEKKWQNWAWDPEYTQLLPMALPGMEGIHVRALVEKEGEKGQKQEMSRNQRLLQVLQMSISN